MPQYAAMQMKTDSLLLDLGVPFRMMRGTLAIESQAANGLARWLENFDSVTVCAPLLPEEFADGTTSWVSAADLAATGRLTLVPFPWGYGPLRHMRNVRAVRSKLRRLVCEHRYLCFSNLGWLGAWGRVAAETAQEMQRPYAVWLDWVLHEMKGAAPANPIRRAWGSLQHAMLRRMSLRDIRQASLGLFHGRTVYEGYAGLCPVSEVVHDIHLKAEDVIETAELATRHARSEGPLRILYVGRVHEMKGPRQWLDAIQEVLRRWNGPRPIQATWMGDGPLLSEMRREVASRGLQAWIQFPGPQMDRRKLLQIYRDADVFAFCHVTPESPRCLIEALMQGLPILGFESAYARDLLAGRSGGEFVAIDDSAGLAALLLGCLESPQKLYRMSLEARAAGTEFSDDKVFAHRSELIKMHLGATHA